MKKCIFFILTTTFCFSISYCQCKESWKKADPEDIYVITEKKFSQELMDKLKATTTVFFYKKGDLASLDSFRNALNTAWDFTPLIFEDISQINTYRSNPKYSYFIISGYLLQARMKIVTSTFTHFWLELRIGGEEDKFCRIELFRRFNLPDDPKTGFRNIYWNWTPTLLRGELQILGENLKKSYRPCTFEKVRDPQLTKLLSNDTLFIPQSLLIDFNRLNGKETFFGKELFKDYKYPFRICSDSELYTIFETEKRGRFVFQYVKSSGFNFISVLDLKEKKAIYKQETNTNKDLKDNDIEKIK